MTLVLNALGGPGSGKSTLAYGLTAKMKAAGWKAELVKEYATELVYRADLTTLANQFLVTAEQDRRVRELLGQVDVIVSDSPLPLGIIYAQAPYNQPWFSRRVWEMFDGYNNFNVFVRRVKPFQKHGRIHDEQESNALDVKVLDLFGQDRLHLTVDGDESAIDKVFEVLKRQLP